MSTHYVQLSSKIQNPHFESVFDVTPEEVSQKQSDLVLIDVRQPEEFTGELGHIPGTQLMVLNTLPQELATIPQDKTVVFVCRSGARSAQAAAFAHMNGYKEVYNMLGGMMLWNNLNLPIER